ncbi:MAG: FG-GAP repeat protein, partial [Bradymonadaceae bacterium]
VYKRTKGSWSEQQKLTAGDADGHDRFGRSVALDGKTVIVGAPGDDHDGHSDAGAAYAFTRSNGSWTQQQKFTSYNAADGDRFGTSVAVAGDAALVGAPDDDHGGDADAGSAYAYVRSGGSWSHQKHITAGAGAGASFGCSVAIDMGEPLTAAIGAMDDNPSGKKGAGTAYLYTRESGGWTQQTQLIAADAAASDSFGWDVALDGDIAVVGAAFDYNAKGQAGAAYVFERSDSAWSQADKFVASDGSGGDRFGYSVDIDGGEVVAGAPGDDFNGKQIAGAAYVFAKRDGTWSEKKKLTASDARGEDHFGRAAAIDEAS